MKHITLQGDDLLALQYFWNSIDTTLTTTLASGKAIVDYASLTSSQTSKENLFPDPNHADFNICHSTYIRLGKILRDHLLTTSTIPYDKAPTAFTTFIRFKIDHNGFRILHQIICLGSPQLGGEERYLYNYVLTLIITPNEDLISFYHRENTRNRK